MNIQITNFGGQHQLLRSTHYAAIAANIAVKLTLLRDCFVLEQYCMLRYDKYHVAVLPPPPTGYDNDDDRMTCFTPPAVVGRGFVHWPAALLLGF